MQTYLITIDPTHAILRGHFHNQPIVPGVCMLDMVKQALRLYTHQTRRIQQVDVVKFLQMWLPDDFISANLLMTITKKEVSTISIKASIQSENKEILNCQITFTT
jgi:3-hydroxymyristoyl/3-hydroxydecanoyl-(acyl carrier protein) dehydratases